MTDKNDADIAKIWAWRSQPQSWSYPCAILLTTFQLLLVTHNELIHSSNRSHTATFLDCPLKSLEHTMKPLP